jgi:hypothetical protein
MTFMYLYIEYKTKEETDGGIFSDGLWASVHEKDAWLGSENSRHSNAPLAVFQIAGFEGLSNISVDNLWDELLNRMPMEELAKKVARHMTADMLTQELRDRIHEPKLRRRRSPFEEDY